MSHILTVELDDQVFESIRKRADAAGTTPAQVVASTLQQQFNGLPRRVDTRTDEEKRVANERFRGLFGSVDLGHPTGLDNQQIDADLAREYSDNHEAQ